MRSLSRYYIAALSHVQREGSGVLVSDLCIGLGFSLADVWVFTAFLYHVLCGLVSLFTEFWKGRNL